jgi:hypothetical protein
MKLGVEGGEWLVGTGNQGQTRFYDNVFPAYSDHFEFHIYSRPYKERYLEYFP